MNNKIAALKAVEKQSIVIAGVSLAGFFGLAALCYSTADIAVSEIYQERRDECVRVMIKEDAQALANAQSFLDGDVTLTITQERIDACAIKEAQERVEFSNGYGQEIASIAMGLFMAGMAGANAVRMRRAINAALRAPTVQ